MSLQMTKTGKQGKWTFRFRFNLVPPDYHGNWLFDLLSVEPVRTPQGYRKQKYSSPELNEIWRESMAAWAILAHQMRIQGPYRQANKRKRKR